MINYHYIQIQILSITIYTNDPLQAGDLTMVKG